MLIRSRLSLLVAAVVALQGLLLSFFLKALEDHAGVGLSFAHCSNLNYDKYIYR